MSLINGTETGEYLEGTSGDDTINGNGGDDHIVGLGGNDSISGGAGHDRIEVTRDGEGGNDTVDGGDGDDSAIYDYGSETEGVFFNATGASGVQMEQDGTTDQLISIEQVQAFGGSGNDVFTGDSQFNFFEGNGGDDTMSGGEGGDMFAWDSGLLSPGTDRITDFSAGEDWLHYRGFNITSVVAGNNPASLAVGQMMVNSGTETTVWVRAANGTLFTAILEDEFLASDFRLEHNEWGTNVMVSAPATEGDDTITGGEGNDVLNGLGGNDFFQPGAGNDTIFGGAGDDYISAGGYWHPGLDVIDGGEGWDTVAYEYNENTTGITFVATGAGGSQLDPLDGSVDSLVGIEQVNVYGGSGNDVLVGDALRNSFSGNGGNDTLTGGVGGDSFSYETNIDNGRDLITDFGTGDWLHFQNLVITGPIQEGDDPSGLAVGEVMIGAPQDGITTLYVRVAAGAGGLTIIDLQGTFSRTNFNLNVNEWGTSLNYMASTAGNDSFWGGAGHEYFFGGGGSDFFSSSGGNDTIDGGAILDRLNYTDLNSISYASAGAGIHLDLEAGTVYKGDGVDTLSNINWVTGSAYNDYLGGSNDASLYERFDGGLGDDTIDGGTGAANRVDYFSVVNGTSTGVNVVLNYEPADPDTETPAVSSGSATGGGGTDTLRNIQHVNGTRYADSITGSDRIDFHEQFNGRGGNDTIDGGGGMDQLRYDSAPLRPDRVGVTVNLELGTASDGEGGTDTLYNIESVRGSANNDLIIGSDAGADGMDHNGDGEVDYEYFIGMAGNDTIDGNGGRDRVDYTTSGAGVYVSLAAGKAFNDGYGTEDTLIDIDAVRGSEFGDRLVGDEFANRLEGRGGEDRLEGGRGNDYIDGGEAVSSPGSTAYDIAEYTNANGSVVVNLETGSATGADGNDTLVGIEGVFGSHFDDTITGASDVSNLIRGNRGNDVLTGGDEFDIVDYRGATGGVTVDFTTERASGADGNDTIVGFEMVIGSDHADTLLGGEGNETFRGWLGNDSIVGGEGIDRADYRGNDNRITSGVQVDLAAGRSTGSHGNDTLVGIENVRGTSFTDHLYGDAGNNYLDGAGGDDDLVGGAGNDTLDGGDGEDVILFRTSTAGVVVDLGTNTAWDETGGEDTLISIEGVIGSGFADALLGDDGNNIFMGGAGDDDVQGREGRDYLAYEDTGDNVGPDTGVVVNMLTGTAQDGYGGNDTFGGIEDVGGTHHADHITADDGSNLLEGLAGNDTLLGNGGADTLLGGDGNDVLGGGLGADLIDGGAGVDTVSYGGAAQGIFVNLAAGRASGNDTVVGIENVIGSAFDDTLTGDDANNRLDGGAGNDTLVGNGGNDTFVVNAAGDVVIEGAGGGTDQVLAGVTYTLAANVEKLTLTGSAGINGTGNALANTLTGNDGNNTLDGGAGKDTMAGGAGNDVYVVDSTGDVVTEEASAGTDTVRTSVTYTLATNLENLVLTGAAAINGTGNALANKLTGNTGNNTLDGDAGADTMAGGAGNDIYVVDNAGDVVTEGSTGGTADRVNASINYVLGANVERLTLTGTANLKGTGNELANTLTGNSGANVLDGQAGADTMVGGAGNDTYVVDNVGDVITETSTGGTDKVNASVSYTLANYVESLTLTGTANLKGTGNALANTLTGNSGANVLDGKAGADTMVGGAGNDTYVVDNTGDRVTETSTGGTDKVNSSVTHTLANYVENLTLTGTGAIKGTGNNLANVIVGNSGANVINGMAGKDTLTGGGGADKFTFTNAAHSTAAAFDVIKDFVRGTDKIDLSTLDANASASGQQDFRFIGKSAFSANATGQLRVELVDGKLMLYGSTDADAAAEFAVQILGTTTLTATDFLF